MKKFTSIIVIVIVLAFIVALFGNCNVNQDDEFTPVEKPVARAIPEEYQQIIRQAYKSGYLGACGVILFSESIEITDQDQLQKEIEEGLKTGLQNY